MMHLESCKKNTSKLIAHKGIGGWRVKVEMISPKCLFSLWKSKNFGNIIPFLWQLCVFVCLFRISVDTLPEKEKTLERRNVHIFLWKYPKLQKKNGANYI